MDTVSWLSLLISLLALVLSGIVFAWDIWHHHIPLQVRVPHFVVLWSKDNQSLVLFRLVFVNQALIGRTVVRVELASPSGTTQSPVAW